MQSLPRIVTITKLFLMNRCLIVQAEIQKVPMVNEPEKTDAGGSQQRVPDLVPNPLLRVAPGFRGTVDGNQRSKAG
jgi:hypothetical protein